MISIVKAVRVISSLGFLGVLLFVYAYLPNLVKLPFDLVNVKEIIIEKGNLFYYAVSVFAVVSIISFFVTRLINTLPPAENNFRRDLTGWSISFVAIINVFLIISLIIISVINNTRPTVASDYSIVAYVGPVLLIIWLLLLVFLVTRRVVAKS